MEEIPGHPLDLSKLELLHPKSWRVTCCGDDMVTIGAWIDELGRLHSRCFRLAKASIEFSERSVHRAES